MAETTKDKVGFLAKLNEYRDVIALMVFFLGGLWWIQGQFPTKTDLNNQQASLKLQIKVLNCQLDKYMRMTQLQLRSQTLDSKITRLNQQLDQMPIGGAHLSPAIEEQRDNLRKEHDDLSKQFETTASEMQTINDELARNVCGRIDS
jgi:hypothetical protein